MTTQLIFKVLLLTLLISSMMRAGLGLTAQLLVAPVRDARRVLTSGSRNVGAALVPATQAGTDPRVMNMLVTGTLVMILILPAACAWLRCRTPIAVLSHDTA